MAIENGTLVYANEDCYAIQAKLENISVYKNVWAKFIIPLTIISQKGNYRTVKYGTDSFDVIDKRLSVLSVYGDLDNDNGLEPKLFQAKKLIGKATGKSTLIEEQLYYEVDIDANYGIQKRKRNFNRLGFEKAGTYEKYVTQGWFLDSTVSETKEKAEYIYKSKEPLLPEKLNEKGVPSLATASGGANSQTTTIIISIAIGISVVLAFLFTKKRKK
jgi:hypothetical protein